MYSPCMPLLTPFKITQEKEVTEEGVFARSYLLAERADSVEDVAGMTCAW